MYQPKVAQVYSDQRHNEMFGEGEDYDLAVRRPRVARPWRRNATAHSHSRLLRVVRVPGGFAFVEDRAALR